MNTKKNFFRWVGMAIGGMMLTHALAGSAATVTVFVGNTNFTGNAADVFVPPSTNINVNDSVVWVWEHNNHSTTSGTNGTPSGLWDSGVYLGSLPFSFTNTFTTAGNFLYFCRVHVSVGMTGVVSVAGADLPPTVAITNPPDGATFSAPASFTLAATASDDGSVTNVQFFQDATSLGNVTTSPYSVAVNNLSAADYSFSAIASDNAGLTATNSITIHVVTPVPIVLSAPQFLLPADFRFNYTANAGLNYIVQRSADLNGSNWITISTNQAGGSPVTFDDTNAAGNPAFYRVGRLPNP